MSELADVARGTGQDARQARRTIKRRAAAAASGRGSGDDFAPLGATLDDLIERIDPAGARALGRALATDLRGFNRTRMRANVQPDGEPMEPRNAQASRTVAGGRIRSKRLRDAPRQPKRQVRDKLMFRRAAEPQYLRMESSQGDAQVGFVGAMARIMAVHQYGQSDTVTRDPESPRVTYPARVVLGIPAADRVRLLDRIAAHAAP